MPAIPINQFSQWNAFYNYEKWNVIYGATPGDTRYFYATTSSFGANPTDQYVYFATNTARQDNVMRLTFNQTGPISFQQGSVACIRDISPDSSANYTGLVLAAGSGWIDYLNPGLNVSNAVVGIGSVLAPIHPYWTTGFFWIPSWTTDVTQNAAVINTQLGEGYSQRMNSVINSNSLSWNMTFAERGDKETMALLNFLQVAGGATPFVLSFPVSNLYNNPNVKYVNQAPKQQLTSFGLNTTTCQISQVFDIG